MSQMLHASLGECLRSLNPSLCSAVSSVRESVLPFGDTSVSIPLYTLSVDLGANPAIDLGLAASIASLIKSQEPSISARNLALFPAAAAAIFASESWENTDYILSYEAFERNEHCMIFAISKLVTCFFGDESLFGAAASAEAKTSSSSSGGDVSRTSGINGVGNLQLMAEAYLRMSSQVLLTLRSVELTAYPTRPLRGMCLLLELFVRFSPAADRRSLEKYLPYSLLHASLVEISLGKHTAAEALGAFTHAGPLGTEFSPGMSSNAFL